MSVILRDLPVGSQNWSSLGLCQPAILRTALCISKLSSKFPILIPLCHCPTHGWSHLLFAQVRQTGQHPGQVAHTTPSPHPRATLATPLLGRKCSSVIGCAETVCRLKLAGVVCVHSFGINIGAFRCAALNRCLDVV